MFCKLLHFPPKIVCLVLWTGVEVKSGSIYCSQCDNFVYHSKLDALYLATIVTAEEKQMGLLLVPPRISLPHRSDTPSSYSETQGIVQTMEPKPEGDPSS